MAKGVSNFFSFLFVILIFFMHHLVAETGDWRSNGRSGMVYVYGDSYIYEYIILRKWNCVSIRIPAIMSH